jgi:hypothetical protein
MVAREEKGRSLKKYWTIPERQAEPSVILADQQSWKASEKEQRIFQSE